MITNIPSNFANSVAAYSSAVSQPTGEASRDDTPTTFRPVEQLAETAATENRVFRQDLSALADQRQALNNFSQGGFSQANTFQGNVRNRSGQAELSSGGSGLRTSPDNSIDEIFGETPSEPALRQGQGVNGESEEGGNAIEGNGVNGASEPDDPFAEVGDNANAAAEETREQQELQEIRELQARDQEVRNHEAAHVAVGGQYAGSPTFEYERGPDGVNYAVAGEVPIDTSEVPSDPEATMRKADQIIRAALAPAEPSSQDRRVAAQATQMRAQAQQDLAAMEREEQAQAAESSELRREEAQARAEEGRALQNAARSATVENIGSIQDINQVVFDLNQRLTAIGVIDSNAPGSVIDAVV
ncbi:putative metalloprotease CJM1_0395 family protein [Marinibactrum halimedae]|uniref:Catalase n=1 Tax=Marinibactrum halimedae TaxID=1444977 RepID=A0AA37WL78_9GAMM|nr:putative metalloprotease CJM1_0395 family protein [Marinibactrum halimedae]MCD9458137.1 hypothetical protein [Marinibactrum halimedae]GLS25070.1 hypothetical protein GCM10007877_07840 [Marinibactrum halimedae]